MNNPFTLSSGKKPLQYVSRISQNSEILENFTAAEPSNQIYMITGVRGSGKTVMMAGKLYSLPEMHAHFVQARIDLTVLGLNVSLENAVPVTDIESAIALMLDELRKKRKRLLFTVDEVTNRDSVRVFASSFQIFLRQEYPIFLLMTGLYDNIYDLQNADALTFLYRAPKMVLEPLNYNAIRKRYMDIFELDVEAAGKMAGLTKGYPFAFQVLGYLHWENRAVKTLEETLPEYDQYLEEYVYGKIGSELSDLDRKVLIRMSTGGETKVKNIREGIGMKPEQFSVYRDRFKRKGVLDTSKYGEVSFVLPRFAEFVLTIIL